MSQPIPSSSEGNPSTRLPLPSPLPSDRSPGNLESLVPDALKSTHSARAYGTIGRKPEKKREAAQNVFNPTATLKPDPPPIQISLVL